MKVIKLPKKKVRVLVEFIMEIDNDDETTLEQANEWYERYTDDEAFASMLSVRPYETVCL